jgi:hypothetical protein
MLDISMKVIFDLTFSEKKKNDLALSKKARKY